MDKWADYLVTGVHYNSDETYIVYVEIRKDKGDTVGAAERFTREAIISSIEAGTTFVTAISKTNEKGEHVWSKGASVNIVIISNTKFIRTDRNQTRKDNLESLPSI